MAVTLVVRSGLSSPDEEPLSVTLDLPRLVLGRGEGCDLRLPDRSVSHRHASIRQRGTEYILLDEGSTNGTFLGSVRLHPQSPRVIRTGDLIRLGRVWLEVRIEFSAATLHNAQATREVALVLVGRGLLAQGESCTPRLLVQSGPDEGKQIELPDGRALVLGRSRDMDLVLDVSDASRRHAQIRRQGDVLHVRDLDSRNGTLVGRARIPIDRDTPLRAGESFQIGTDSFVFEHPASEVLRELEHADDEVIDSREPIDPPQGVELPEVPVAQVPSVEPDAPGPPSVRTPLQSDAGPLSTPRPGRPKPSGGWGQADVLILVLALAVIALSVVGFVLLLRSS